MARTSTCPICKQGSLRRWRGTESQHGITIDVVGHRCSACGEIFFDDAEMRRQERALATGLAARGVRNGVEFKLLRKVLGLKATEVAAILDVRPETVSRWEHGELALPRLAAFAVGELFEHPRVIRAKLEALAHR